MGLAMNGALGRAARAILLSAVSYLVVSDARNGAAAQQSQNLPPVRIDAPKPRAATSTARRGTATRSFRTVQRVAAPQPAQAASATPTPSTGTVGAPPVPFAGGQVGSGARLGFLGNKSIFDTPFSVSSYTEKLIRDQQATTLADVLANDASVRTATGPFGVGDYVVLRGFATGENDVAFDGMYGLANVRRPILEGVERVEVMKGPSALLFGFSPSGTPGGIINLIPKRAPDAPLTRISADYFSDSNIGGKFDVARRFGADNAFGVRLNGAFRDGHTPIENQNVKAGVFTAGLDYRGDQFRASLDLGYQKYDTRAPNYTFGIDPGVIVPRAPDVARNIQQSWSYINTEHIFGLARAEYDFARDWTVFGAVGARQMSEQYLFAFPTITNTAGDVSQAGLAAPVEYANVTWETGIRGRFDTGPITHAVTVVGNRYRERTESAFSFIPSAETTNIYNPVTLTRPDVGDVFSRPRDVGVSVLSGVTIADTLSILDERVQLTVGGRMQRAETVGFDPAGLQTGSYDKSAATPLVGFVVKPLKPLSLYASYAEGFGFGPTAPFGSSNFNQVFAPVISKQVETGAKLDLGFIGSTLAFYEINRPFGITNVITNIFGLDGLQRNRGVEFNVFGEPIKGVRLLSGVSVNNAKLERTEGGLFDGNAVPGVPTTQINAGGELDLPPWLIPGFTLTGRAIYTSAAFVDQANTQWIPDWTRFDLGARYRFEVNKTQMVARFNVENVAGTNYWASAFNGRLVTGTPRIFRFSLSADL